MEILANATYTIEEAATWLRVDLKTFRKMLTTGQIKCIQPDGMRTVRIIGKDLLEMGKPKGAS